MLKEALREISASPTIAIVALLIFVAAFVGVVIWALRLDRKYRRRMSRMPLDSAEDDIDEDESDG